MTIHMRFPKNPKKVPSALALCLPWVCASRCVCAASPSRLQYTMETLCFSLFFIVRISFKMQSYHGVTKQKVKKCASLLNKFNIF